MAFAFCTAAATWWIYFDHGERIGAEAMEASDAPGRLARTAYTYVHLLVIGGIVLVSVGDKQVLSHPHEQSVPATLAVIGGPLLFLAGTLCFRRLLEGRWMVAHAAGIIALVTVGLAAAAMSPLATSGATTAVLFGVAALETAQRMRRGRRPGG